MNLRIRTRKIRKKTRTSPYQHLLPELAHMPRLDHWPDRPVPFKPERSQVLAFIVESYGCDLGQAERIFQAARNAGMVRFNPDTRQWIGRKGGRP